MIYCKNYQEHSTVFSNNSLLNVIFVGSSQSGAIRQVVQAVQPVVQSVVRQETVASSSSASDDGDLVARIISQLTPYIQVWNNLFLAKY